MGGLLQVGGRKGVFYRRRMKNKRENGLLKVVGIMEKKSGEDPVHRKKKKSSQRGKPFQSLETKKSP